MIKGPFHYADLATILRFVQVGLDRGKNEPIQSQYDGAALSEHCIYDKHALATF